MWGFATETVTMQERVLLAVVVQLDARLSEQTGALCPHLILQKVMTRGMQGFLWCVQHHFMYS